MGDAMMMIADACLGIFALYLALIAPPFAQRDPDDPALK
jgi:hypothetical protein